MKITPVGRKILVKKSSNSEKFANGLTVKRTVTSRRDIHSGNVVALGTSLFDSEVVHIGDLVFFPAYAAQSIAVDGEDYLVLQLDDIDIVASKQIEGGL